MVFICRTETITAEGDSSAQDGYSKDDSSTIWRQRKENARACLRLIFGYSTVLSVIEYHSDPALSRTTMNQEAKSYHKRDTSAHHNESFEPMAVATLSAQREVGECLKITSFPAP
jgi:hypothetical protein